MAAFGFRARAISRYRAFLARTDLDRGGPVVISPQTAADSAQESVDATVEVREFLEMAVPALENYERRKEGAGIHPEGGRDDDQAESQFWREFLDERDEILRLKWIESEKAGRDIGYERAIQLWLKHRPGWQMAHAAAAR
jgi:hypothetical protein